MNKLALIACTCFFYIACSNSKTLPDGIISSEKMQPLLWDMMQVDQFINTYVAKDTSKNLQEESIHYYEKVFRLHKITKEQFEKSYRYYQSRPELAHVLFDSIATQAARRRYEVFKPTNPTQRDPNDTPRKGKSPLPLHVE